MNHLIERYVYDVVRRLPEKDREEVSKELKANIYDMLPEDADEDEIKAVLYRLGPPASLAEQYRQKPRYLISPAIYDEYVRVLKWALPFIGSILLVVGMVLGAIDAIKDGMVDIAYLISNTLSKGISMGVSAALQALVWITAGFAITERVNANAGRSKESEGKAQEWNVEDLPEVSAPDKGRIPLSDSITELVLVVIFSIVAILYCLGTFPMTFIIQNGDTQVRTLFSSSFLAICVPAIAVTATLSVFECIAKIKDRRWTPLVCITVIISNLISMCLTVYLVNRPDLLSTEFTDFASSMEWGSFDLMRFMGSAVENPIILLITVICVICSLLGCCSAVFKTLKSSQ